MVHQESRQDVARSRERERGTASLTLYGMDEKRILTNEGNLRKGLKRKSDGDATRRRRRIRGTIPLPRPPAPAE